MDNNQTTEEVLRDQKIEKEIEPEYLKEESLVYKQRLRYAGFWMRFWAYLLDLIVVGSIDRILVKPLFRFLDIPLLESSLFAPISIATAITFYAYFVLMTRYFQQTLGKMVFGLRVVGLVEERLSWKTILFREWIGRFISSTIVIGYIITAFLPKKQGLHDLFSDTSVVHEY
jgi:uncharacterized RDD family membrane protein YckC